MFITIGSGNSRDTFNIGHRQSRSKEGTERVSWELKKLLYEKHIISGLK